MISDFIYVVAIPLSNMCLSAADMPVGEGHQLLPAGTSVHLASRPGGYRVQGPVRLRLPSSPGVLRAAVRQPAGLQLVPLTQQHFDVPEL